MFTTDKFKSWINLTVCTVRQLSVDSKQCAILLNSVCNVSAKWQVTVCSTTSSLWIQLMMATRSKADRLYVLSNKTCYRCCDYLWLEAFWLKKCVSPCVFLLVLASLASLSSAQFDQVVSPGEHKYLYLNTALQILQSDFCPTLHPSYRADCIGVLCRLAGVLGWLWKKKKNRVCPVI